MALKDYSVPFTSYNPHPDIPGAYNFSKPDGSSMMFTGDTSGMRRAIDSMPDMRTAELDPSTGIDLSRPSPVASDATRATPMTNPMSQVQNMPNASLEPPQVQNLPNASAISPQDLKLAAASRASTPTESAGQEEMPAGPPVRNIVPQASSASQAAPRSGGQAPDLNQVMGMTRVVHTPAGWHPSTESVETKGAVQDPAMQKALAESYVARSKAATDYAEADKLQQFSVAAQAEVAANEAAKEADMRAQRERDLLAAQQQSLDEYKRIMGIKQNELADASKREVDQNRLFKGNSGAAIGAALAAGLGAFGASLTHSPNFAMDFITRAIDRDVEAQKGEINRGIASKQNDIARIRDQYNVSTPIAEKLLGINLAERTQALARKQAAVAGGQAAQEKLLGIDKQLEDYKGGLLQDMQKTLYGDATVKVDNKYSQGGDSIQLTNEAKRLVKGSEAYGTIGKGLGTGAGGEFEAAHEGRTAAQVDKGAGGGKESPRISMKRAVNESALEDLPALEKADRGGRFGPAEMPDILKSDERKNTEAAAAALVSKLTDAAGDPATEAVRHDMYSRLTASDPEVRAKTRAALMGGTQTYGKALERASERSRGVGDMSGGAEEK